MSAFAERFASLPVSPLRVTAALVDNAPVAAYDPIHLDNLLARAVVDEATQNMGLPNAGSPYALPVPLQCLWRSADGLPLWASTVFRPVGESAPDTIYTHKRAQSGAFTLHGSGAPLALHTTKGRWMERRTPVPVVIAPVWEADCMGNAQEVLRLLCGIRFLGKRRGIGFGEVREWRVEQIEGFSLVQDGKLRRPLPLEFSLTPEAAGSLPGTPAGAVSLVGWTPPQWLPSAHEPGWATGTPLTG